MLADDYDITWIIINTKNSKRRVEGVISDKLPNREINLEYKQRDPRIIAQFFRIAMDVRKGDYDLVYISFHGLPYFFPIFFSLVDMKKVIYGTHNVSTPKGASNEKMMRAYHKYAYKKFRHYHVFSKFQLDVIREMIPGKKHYYAPIALKDYGTSNATPPTDRIRFLFFGYIRDYKRLDLLIKSFQELYHSGVKNIELYIAGNCENWKPYEALIEEGMPIVSRIEIIPDDDIPDTVASSHYMVLPYKDGAQSAVLTVAYQYGKPVIVSDIESFKQFVTEGETGFVFKNGDQESLTSVMKKVVDQHEAHYDGLKQNIKAYIEEEFAIGKIVDRYKDFIEETLKG